MGTPGASGLAALLLTIAALLGTEPPRADERPAPARGRFLVAQRGVEGPFARSVILLLEHGEEGSLGLVVNRPTRFPLAQLLPDQDSIAERDDRVFSGGPVAQESVLLLVSGPEAPPDATAVMPGVWVSGSLATLDAALASERASFRAYAGHAGWAPHQLEGELARGTWWVSGADAATVFSDDPGAVWSALVRRLEGVRVRAPRRSAKR